MLNWHGGSPRRPRASTDVLALLHDLITPAVVSLLISLWANRLLEARRAEREHLTKLFEVAREDVRRASEAAVDYFSTAPGQRSPLQEAKVLAAEREVREAISPLTRSASDEGENRMRAPAAAAFVTMLAELTGGNFQAVAGEIDRQHLNRLVFACASLRSALAKLREDQLASLVERDFIRSRWIETRSLWRENNPFRRSVP